MELMEGYKQTELGVFPNNWEITLMGKVGETIIGLTYSPKDVNETGILVLRSSNVQNNQLSFKDNVYVSGDIPERVIVKEKDILICVRNGSKKLIGKCAMIDKKTEGQAFGAFMSIYRSKYSEYIFYTFQSHLIQKQIDATMGATINQITNKNLDEFKIPLPPLPEQIAIATVLSDTDQLIQAIEKKIAKKRLIKQGAMQELLRPKEGWVERKLTQVVHYIHGKAHENHIVDNGRYIAVNSKFISTEGKVVKRTDVNFCRALKGDVLTVLSDLPNGKALAKCYYVEEDEKYAVNQRICIWRSKNAFPKFIFHLLNRHNYFLKLDDGVTQTHILNHHIEKCIISIPEEVELQISIATILSDMDSQIENLENQLAKYKELKQGLMQNLLTGKIRLV